MTLTAKHLEGWSCHTERMHKPRGILNVILHVRCRTSLNPFSGVFIRSMSHSKGEFYFLLPAFKVPRAGLCSDTPGTVLGSLSCLYCSIPEDFHSPFTTQCVHARNIYYIFCTMSLLSVVCIYCLWHVFIVGTMYYLSSLLDPGLPLT
jgi:hypothetical protein